MKKVLLWFNALLLAVFPIFEGLIQLLPALQAYLPDNIYRTVGLIVVLSHFALALLMEKKVKP